MTLPVTVSFRTSYGEHVRALRAINGAIPRVQRLRRIGLWLLGVSVLLFALAVVLPRSRVALVLLATAALLFPLIIYGIIWTMPFYLAWLGRRQSAMWNGELTYSFTDAGIASGASASSGFLSWDAIVRAAATPEFVVYFTSDQAGYFVPTRALPQGVSGEALVELIRDRSSRPVDSVARARVAASSTFTSPPRVSATFDIEADELSRAIMVMSRKSGTLWPWFLFIILVVAWTSGPAIYQQWRAGGWSAVSLTTLLLAAFPLVLVAAAMPLAARLFARREQRTNRSARGPQTVALHDEGIALRGALYTGEFRWPAISRAVETADFYLFFLSKVQAVYLPKRMLNEDGVLAARQLLLERLAGRAAVMQSRIVT